MTATESSDVRPMLRDRVGNILQILIAGPEFQDERHAQVALLRAAAEIRAVIDRATLDGVAQWSRSRPAA